MIRERAQDIEAAAAAWVVRFDAASTAVERARREAAAADWAGEDPRRQGALLQAEAAWARLDRASVASAAAPRRRGLPRRGLIVGAGAALAASVAAGVAVLGGGERYATRVGEIRRIPLKDGSTAAINTGSVLAVDLAPARRRVRLAEGEAWFQVAKDPNRPFVVEAGQARVQAVGTAFSVRRRDGAVEVMVSEGIVEAWIEGQPGPRTRLAAGERATLEGSAPIATVAAAPSEIERQLAWRSGKIDLAGEPLATAAAEFNRYNDRRIVVEHRLAGEGLYGVFRTDDPEGFARAAAQSLGGVVSIAADGTITIAATGG